MEAELALGVWNKAKHDLKAAAFATYRAALDREEQAAANLAARVAAELASGARGSATSPRTAPVTWCQRSRGWAPLARAAANRTELSCMSSATAAFTVVG